MKERRPEDCGKRDRWSVRGTSSVEFAIILPIFLLFVFGIIQFGLGWWVSQIITNASREGARFGIVVSDPPVSDVQVTARVQTYLNASLGAAADDAVIEVKYKNGLADATFATCPSGCEATVSVWIPTVNIVPSLVPFDIFPATLSATSTMRHE